MVRKKWHQGLAFLVAAALLLWLPVEDVGILPVLLTSLSVCTAAAIWYLRARAGVGPRQFMIACTAAGLAVSPLAVLLMIFKGGLHGHGAPDFSLADILEVLSRTPFWTISGLLVGAALAFIWTGYTIEESQG